MPPGAGMPAIPPGPAMPPGPGIPGPIGPGIMPGIPGIAKGGIAPGGIAPGGIIPGPIMPGGIGMPGAKVRGDAENGSSASPSGRGMRLPPVPSSVMIFASPSFSPFCSARNRAFC